MKELKKHLSISGQVQLLKSRGLVISDDAAAESILTNINYYRLSGYLHDFKNPNSDTYIDGHSLVWLKRIYDFDRKFTRILMYALEDIEETFKTRFSYVITSAYPDDPLVYLKPTIYREYQAYLKFLSRFYDNVDSNKKHPIVKHHIADYGGFLPMWVAVELLTMGNLLAVYNNLEVRFQKQLARTYQTGVKQLASWLENLTYTRNHLAHYMRIYNFNFGRTPAKCKNHRAYSDSTQMIFDQLYIISCMYSDSAEWNDYIVPEIRRVIEEYSGDILLSSIGFPDNWDKILRH